jgi:ABC-2 type transport system permease protein
MSLLVVFFVGAALGGMIDWMFRTSWGSVINITTMMRAIWAGLFGVEPPTDTPLWVAWTSPALFCVVCVLLLARKLRPYEVVR